MARIVLLGATGYTGRLVAEELAAAGSRPLLAGRKREQLEALSHDLGGLETAVADVTRPHSVRELIDRDDVLITTVGPFVRFGEAAASAAVDAGAFYLDSTGEHAWIRRLFEEYGPRAERSGAKLLTAFGYDYVPGNLAAALALREAGRQAVRVEVAYFAFGTVGSGSVSGGTHASFLHGSLYPSYTLRSGAIVTERPARRLRHFDVRATARPAISVGTTEPFALPRAFPQLRDVDVYLGWFGDKSRGMVRASAVSGAIMRIPGARTLGKQVVSRAAKGSSGGPDADERARGESYVFARAFDAGGGQLAEAHLAGSEPYNFTASILSWGSRRAVAGEVEGVGTLGPVEAFGLDALEAGCAEAGLRRVDP